MDNNISAQNNPNSTSNVPNPVNQINPPDQSAPIPAQSTPPTQPPPPQTPVPPSNPDKPGSKNLKIIFMVIITLFLLAILLIGGFFWIKARNKSNIVPPDGKVSFNVGPENKSSITQSPQPALTLTPSKYEIDTDSDGIPDFVESGVGSDPKINECALEVGCGTVDAVEKKQINVLFILDSSGSMAGNVAGGQKMAIAKEAMKRYIDQLPETIKAGLMVYGHKGSNNTTDKAASCAGIELLYSIQTVDKTQFKAKIDSFSPTGWTPIADSFNQAKAAFSNMEGDINKIVLISDGIETCGGQPCNIAKELNESGIEALIDVIGFDVDQTAKNQLQCIAQSTGGTYFNAKTAQEFNDIINKLGEESKKFSESSGCLAEKLGDYLGCLIDQFEKALSYLNPLCLDLRSSGNTEEADACLQTINTLSGKNADMIRESAQYTKEETQKLIDKAKQLTR